jgi:hypothetical protein
MTDLRAAAQQALEALEDSLSDDLTPYQAAKISAALRAALAEHHCDTHCTWADHAPGCVRAEPVEPVAWGVFGANLHDMFFTEEEAHEMARLKGDGSTVAPLYTAPPQHPAEPLQEPYTGDVTRIIREAGMTFHLGLPHKPVIEQMSRVVDLVYAEASIKAAQQFAASPQRLPLTDEECDAVMLALDGWARGVDHYEYGLPIHNEELRETARAVIRATHGIGSKT